MRLIPLALLAFSILAGFARPFPVAGAPLSFDQVLEAVDACYEKINTLKASFDQVVEVPVLEKKENFRGRLYYMKPEYLRLEYDKPKGQLLVADGSWYWFVMPQPDMLQAMRTPMRQGETGPRYVLGGGMLERYSGSLAGIEKRRGVPTYVLDLAPNSPSPYYRHLRAWIDTSSFATRAVQYIDESGNFNTFDLFKLEENVPLSPALFVYNPPPGTQILDIE